MNKACPHCQTQNPPEAHLCRNCGRPLTLEAASILSGEGPQTTVHWTKGLLQPKVSLRRSTPLDQMFAKKSKVRIGRAPDCDVVLNHPMISRQHAELERMADGRLRLTDLGSMNGITVGGKRLQAGSTWVRESEPIGMGPFLFTLVGKTIYTLDNSRGLRLQAEALQKVIQLPDGKLRKLLDNINLVIEPGEFVTLLGPSGSGKSTLMDCLNGRRRATGGRVLANGADFYGHFDNFRQSLGYVPQKDIVHTQLTVVRALYYTAQLRLPSDTTNKELGMRVEEVIQLMELGPHRDTLVADLSGGQIKRVSLGAELLARPSMLYIDEATSGLDAGTEARMMKLFRALADEGKSLVCITHNIDHVDRCHLILVLARGKLMYYGPPGEACPYFGVSRISEIYDRLQDREVETWEKQYAESSLHQEFIAKRLAAEPSQHAPTPGPAPEVSAPAPSSTSSSGLNFSSSSLPMPQETKLPPPRPQHTPWWHQFRVLTLRYLELIWTDRRSLRLTLLQAPLIALFVLAGFVGKPFQQKIPVPNISDEEYLALKMMLAFGDDLNADAKADEAAEKLRFRIHHSEDETAGKDISHRDLLQELKKLRANPNSKQLLDKVAITIEMDEDDDVPKRVQRKASQLLDLHKGLQHTKITQQLLEAHEVAGTISPRYTYIILFLMSIIILWAGCNNAAKEIIKEEAVYGRERAVNLGIFPYLASKFLVMSLFTMLQTLMLMIMVYGTLHVMQWWRPSFVTFHEVPPTQYMLNYVSQFGVLCLLSMAGVALGLLLSACVATPDRANALLPYVLIPQIILGGGIMPIRGGVLQWLAWLMSPEYWAYRAIRLGESSLPDVMADNRMEYTDTLWLPCTILCVETAVMLGLTAWFLRKKDAS